jgi:sulfotransferase family protein
LADTLVPSTSTQEEPLQGNENFSTYVGRWQAREHRIAALLPGELAHDRGHLLSEIGDYAKVALREARDTFDEGCVAPSPQENHWLQSPVFICGCHRSGTTLVQQLLDGHPDLLVLPSEGTYFSSFRYVAEAAPTEEDLDRFLLDWVARLIDPNSRPHFKLGVTTSSGNPSVIFCRRFLSWYRVLKRSDTPLTLIAPLLSLIAAYKDVAAPTGLPLMWVEKTPLNEFNVARLSEIPNARFIHMLRDPRAALGSLRTAHDKAGRRDFHLERQADLIGSSFRLADRNEHALAGRYLTVRYEDLAADPELTMDRICEFLGIERVPSSLTPTVGTTPTSSNSSFVTPPPGVIHRPCTQNVLSPEEERFLAALLGNIARKRGYSFPAVPPIRRWQARARVKFARGRRVLSGFTSTRDR